jgi:hypothetical protein
MIASIYAGRSQAMGAAIAPIQVDEVCIWPPTRDQLHEATATAWTSERGLRSFVCGNQLVANNGQVVMEMSNMRGTLYEAAIPQSASSGIEPMPYGEMVWKKDADLLQSVETVHEFVELAVFKNPALKVLDVTGQCRMNLLHDLPGVNYVALASEETSADIDLTEISNATVKVVEEDKALLEQGLAVESFDIVVANKGTYSQGDLYQLCSKVGIVLLESDGTVVIDRPTAQQGTLNGEIVEAKANIHLVHSAADSVVVEAVQR